ncbi:MAG: sodium:calcium antiporter [Proteobacteria bacterium]|nr:sodium:calcium antiporter [Pseudomonadota bacterium]
MTDYLVPIALLLGAAVVIYLSCEFFVNGVEWIGRKLDFGQKAVGTVLAAFGTALPESVVTLVAVAFGKDAAHKQIGVGAALGGPLVLATVAYAVVGWSLYATKRPYPGNDADRRAFGHLSRDQGWFLCIFLVKLGLGLVAFTIKPWLGIAFLAAYGLYVWKETRTGGDGEEGEDLEPLKLQPKAAVPSLAMAFLQTGIAVAVIYLASRLFVSQIGVLGPRLGVPPQLLALFVSPIATELPETMNAIIWIRQGKVRLALANISGAMMIQATIPTAFGLFWTPWRLDAPLLIAGGVTAVAIAVLFAAFRSGRAHRGLLCAMALGYLAFVGAIVAFG